MKEGWFKNNKMRLAIVIAVYTVLLIALTACLIIFTPIREYIPGYTDVTLTYRVYNME